LDGYAVNREFDLLARAPGRLVWVPELDCLVQIIQEQTQLFGLEVGETKIENSVAPFPRSTQQLDGEHVGPGLLPERFFQSAKRRFFGCRF
jgi:hypothetical protein